MEDEGAVIVLVSAGIIAGAWWWYENHHSPTPNHDPLTCPKAATDIVDMYATLKKTKSAALKTQMCHEIGFYRAKCEGEALNPTIDQIESDQCLNS